MVIGEKKLFNRVAFSIGVEEWSQINYGRPSRKHSER